MELSVLLIVLAINRTENSAVKVRKSPDNVSIELGKFGYHFYALLAERSEENVGSTISVGASY